MKRLGIFNWLEHQIRHRKVQRERLGRIDLTRHVDKPSMLDRVPVVHVVDYRIHIGARVAVQDSTDGAWDEARAKVCALMGREMFTDLTGELLDLREYVFEEGIGRDVEDRITRIIALTRGEEVPDVPHS
ncbi:hypothetical protein FDH38_gp004 [Dinoroseobacter phage vB_DshS-R5C]|uniref:Uncharacterized protein n=1 Tax=Dinoroseobacter phage vB_DshS-R5C TaxID=1965368 RepID=A0A1V0DY44_9CAUD|nr:hypothetical protein FDH38_gp004 [Dinoroseobacter phage vB_DshS-R5C]ARB06058.1 hypothetical protein vBDshSR5C_4 [Dinoroseobacter phage vB_DshS-R5C]